MLVVQLAQAARSIRFYQHTKYMQLMSTLVAAPKVNTLEKELTTADAQTKVMTNCQLVKLSRLLIIQVAQQSLQIAKTLEVKFS